MCTHLVMQLIWCQQCFFPYVYVYQFFGTSKELHGGAGCILWWVCIFDPCGAICPAVLHLSLKRGWEDQSWFQWSKHSVMEQVWGHGQSVPWWDSELNQNFPKQKYSNTNWNVRYHAKQLIGRFSWCSLLLLGCFKSALDIVYSSVCFSVVETCFLT